MNINAYVGIGAIVVGLAMSVRGLWRREYAAALNHLIFCLLGATVLTISLGWASPAVVAGIFLAGFSIRIAASRLSRPKGS
ncbi:MAG: hypothetical protein AABZ80_01545 [Gemmatimonadota bacterium]